MDFHSLIKSLSPVCYLPLLKGRLAKEDGYGGSPTLLNSPGFVPTPKGWGLRPNDGGLVVVDSGTRTELQQTAFTLFIAADFNHGTEGETQRVMGKRDPGGFMWDLRFYWSGGNPWFSIFDSGDRAKQYDLSESVCATWVIQHGAQPYIFNTTRGGVFVDGGTTTSGGNANITVNDANLHIGNWYAGSGSQPCKFPFHAVAMIPGVLDDEVIAAIHHQYFLASIGTKEPGLSSPRIHQVANPLVRLSGEVRNGQAIDTSDNAIHFDKTPGVEMHEVTSSGRGFNAHGGAAGRAEAYLTATDTRLDNVSAKTIAFTYRRDSGGELNAGRILSKALEVLVVRTNASGDLILSELWSGGNSLWSISSVFVANLEVHVVIRHDGVEGSVPEIDIDGEAASVITNTPSSGSKSDDTGALNLLDRPALGREADGVLSDFQFFERYLTDAETKDLYLRTALRVLDRGFSHRYPEVPIASTSLVGPWQDFISGSAYWDENNRLIATAGTEASFPCAYDYHAMYFEFLKNAGNSIALWYSVDRADLNGYQLLINSNERVQLRRQQAGVFATVDETGDSYVANDTRYGGFIARTTGDRWRVWLRGGAFATWTIVLDDTNSNIQGSELAKITAGLDDEISDLALFKYGGGLSPNDVPWLAD